MMSNNTCLRYIVFVSYFVHFSLCSIILEAVSQCLFRYLVRFQRKQSISTKLNYGDYIDDTGNFPCVIWDVKIEIHVTKRDKVCDSYLYIEYYYKTHCVI